VSDRQKTKVQWQLGNKCNYHCTYCHHIFYDNTQPFAEDSIILDTCKDIIFHYDDLDRSVVFEFIGGEPTLLDKLPNITERLHNHPVDIVLKTNGSAPLEWWQRAVKNLSDVVISVHREFCDLTHIKELIHFLKTNPYSHDINVEILIPVTNHDESWVWGITTVRELKTLHDNVSLQMLYSNFGSGSTMYLPYSDEQWNQYKKLKGTQDTPVASDNLSKPIVGFKNLTCFAGIDTLAIDYKGYVWRGWCSQGNSLGNIFEKNVVWPRDPIICQKEACTNGFDRQAQKV
jgi:MoaA/NifB/PqqE/SkfB family radical SAM enzyme